MSGSAAGLSPRSSYLLPVLCPHNCCAPCPHILCTPQIAPKPPQKSIESKSTRRRGQSRDILVEKQLIGQQFPQANYFFHIERLDCRLSLNCCISCAPRTAVRPPVRNIVVASQPQCKGPPYAARSLHQNTNMRTQKLMAPLYRFTT